MSVPAVTTVHHLYVRPGDLLPACGVTPGPDRDPWSSDWHTGHDATMLLTLRADGHLCCSLCLQLADPDLGIDLDQRSTVDG
jgi:hypothetical protein